MPSRQQMDWAYSITAPWPTWANSSKCKQSKGWYDNWGQSWS